MPETLSSLQWEILRRLGLGLSLRGMVSAEDRRALKEQGLIIVSGDVLELTAQGAQLLPSRPEPAARTGIRCSVDRARSILMIEIDAELTAGLMGDVERLVRVYREKHGPADVILDLTRATGTLDAGFVRQRGSVPGTMAGRKRIFVVSESHHYGLARMYRAHKESIGETTPAIARTVELALEALGGDRADLRPLSLD